MSAYRQAVWSRHKAQDVPIESDSRLSLMVTGSFRKGVDFFDLLLTFFSIALILPARRVVRKHLADGGGLQLVVTVFLFFAVMLYTPR